MAVIRNYKTEYECAQCWVTEGWSYIDSWVITEGDGYWERWSFYAIDADGYLAPAREPSWATFFTPNDEEDKQWLAQNAEEVAGLGFTVIYHGSDAWGLGVDAEGFDFYEYLWLPLYRMRGFAWHYDR